MGKTSVIDMLESSGYCCIHESGRDIIRHEQETNGNKLPWGDRVGFANEMFKKAVADYNTEFNKEEFVFFDRGIPDVIGYLVLCDLPVAGEMWAAAKSYRYNETVFITPPWCEIYVNDAQRKQTFEEAEATFDVMKQIYKGLGYSLIELPKFSIRERASFVLKNMK